MEQLRAYLNAMQRATQREFAARCGTSLQYLRNALSRQQKLGIELCIEIERQSDRRVRCEDLRPDVDWVYLSSRRADVRRKA